MSRPSPTATAGAQPSHGGLATDPRAVAAVLAVAVRALVAWQGWTRNPAVRRVWLDAEFYLAWARGIAGGDLLGRHGVIGGEPFLLNPLYAYVIAPVAGVFGATPGPVVVLQVLLSGATAALTAAAALRFSGRTAAWVAGLGVAFSAVLTQLDAHVSVSGLAAFLVAGACWACAPGGGRGHGPVAAGLWYGLSALARPVAMLALPFAAALHALRSDRRVRAAALVLGAFGACAAVSFARNLAVSGEPVVFTAANGQNLHLGNNTAARARRTMTTDEFRFGPQDMHVDAKFRVAADLGREPTRSEISSWYVRQTIDECLAHPGASLAWYGLKLKWFFSPEEPPSSADFDWDRTHAPLLGFAFVPTWVLIVLAALGAVAAADRRGLLLGPGALVLAHAAACTLSFPLSHYRSPAVPALAVLAGVGVAAALHGLKTELTPRLRAGFAAALAAALVALVPPQPPFQRDAFLVNAAGAALANRDPAEAERFAREGLAENPDSLGALVALAEAARMRRDPADSRAWSEKIAARQPWNPLISEQMAWRDVELGRDAEAVAQMDREVTRYPWSAAVRRARGEIRCRAGDIDGAREDLRFALAHGEQPDGWALEKCGLTE